MLGEGISRPTVGPFHRRYRYPCHHRNICGDFVVQGVRSRSVIARRLDRRILGSVYLHRTISELTRPECVAQTAESFQLGGGALW